MSRLRRGPNGLPVASNTPPSHPAAAEKALNRAAAVLAKSNVTKPRVSVTARPISGKTRVTGRVSTKAVTTRVSTRSSSSAAASAYSAMKSSDAARMKAETKKLEEETRAMEEKLRALQSRLASEKKDGDNSATWGAGVQGPLKKTAIGSAKMPKKLVGARVVKGEGGKVVVRVRKSALSPAEPGREGGSKLAKALEEARASRSEAGVGSPEPGVGGEIVVNKEPVSSAANGLWRPRQAPRPAATTEAGAGMESSAEGGTGTGGGLLLQGSYDEAANAASFAEAVAQWRGGAKVGNGDEERPSTATHDAGVGSEDVVGSGGASVMPEWSFKTSSGLSYGNRLLLKKLRSAAESRGEEVPTC